MWSRARAFADDPRTAAVLLATAVLLIGSSILSITLVDDAETVAAAGPAPSDSMTTTSTTGAQAARSANDEPGAGTGAAPAGPGSDRDITPTTATDAPPPSTPASELTVTRPGSYRERITTTNSDGAQETQDADLVVEHLGGGSDDLRVRMRRESDGRDIGVSQDLAWRADGVYVLVTDMGGGGFEIHCEHDPPLLQTPRRLEAGTSWSDEGTCEFDTAGGGTVHFRYEATVIEATTVMVAGAQVAAWLIDTVTDVEVSTSFGDFQQHSEGPLWVDPTRGLTVRSEEDVTVTGVQGGGQGAQRSHVTRELLSLDPS